MTKLDKAIHDKKEKLKAIAKANGIYENFGRKEVRKLEEEFDVFFSPEKQKKVNKFSEWCMTFDLSKLEEVTK